MRLFLYGSLLDPPTLAAHSGDPGLPWRLRPALLAGWRRVTAKNGRFPTLVRDRTGSVEGAVTAVSAAAVRRLQAYEGAAYRLVAIRARIADGRSVRAHAWIAPATRRPWRP